MSSVPELMMFGVPATQTPIHFEAREREVFEALDPAIDDRRVNVRVYETADLSTLVSGLADAAFTGLHIVAHGREGGLVFVDSGFGDATLQVVMPEMLARAIARRNLTFAVLNICHSKVLAEAFAPHVDCVIGVDQAVNHETASHFNRGFYKALAKGQSIGEAFFQGQTAVISHATWADSIVLEGRRKAEADTIVPFPAAPPPADEAPDVFIIGGAIHEAAIRRLKGHLAPATSFSVTVDLDPEMVIQGIAPAKLTGARLVIILVGPAEDDDYYSADQIVAAIRARCGRSRVSFFPVFLPGHDPQTGRIPYGLNGVVGVRIASTAHFPEAAQQISRALARFPRA